MIRVEDVVIDGRESKIPLRIYTPIERKTKGIVVYYHWGGFVSGGIEESDAECRFISSLCGCTVVSVGYRLAPRYRFPAAVVDCFDALKWVYEHAEELGGDRDSICVMGVSAGGNLAAIVSILARDSGIKLKCQALVLPVIGFDIYSESARIYGEKGNPLDIDSIIDFTTKYLGDLKEAFNPLFTPILSNLSNLPPALVITAEKDALRDQGEMYAKRLRDFKVPVISIRLNGIGHMLDERYGKFVNIIVAAYLKEMLSQ
ncbi:MAG: alpha/beta hydrolase [Ignisphaera sp.]